MTPRQEAQLRKFLAARSLAAVTGDPADLGARDGQAGQYAAAFNLRRRRYRDCEWHALRISAAISDARPTRRERHAQERRRVA